MTDYENELHERANGLLARKAQNLDIDPIDAFTGIDWMADNDAYFSKLITGKVLRPQDVTKRKAEERHRGNLLAMFGMVPKTPMEFVAARADADNITVDWKGLMHIAGKFQTILDLQRLMRISNQEMNLGFERGDMDDASQQFYEDAKATRPAIMDEVFSKRAEFPWGKFVRTYFKPSDEMDYPLMEAVLKKFIHQCRLKLRDRKVSYHLMPVIHGPQGCGKTYLMEQMLLPIREAVSWSNFDQVTDDRNIDLWNSLVIVLDEMARAAKADVETIKHVVTAETLDRRPMRSNATVAVKNRAVMIGASNHRLDELIKDETGNRRFVELIFRTDAPRHTATGKPMIGEFDFAAMWASVQPDDADPLEAFRTELATAQELYAVVGPVQDYLDSGKHIGLFNRNGANGVSTADLYDDFKNHRHAVTSGIDYQARTQNAFATELRRITDQFEAKYGFRKQHTMRGNRWFCSMAKGLTLLEGGAA